jgi:acetyltransferase-like isoleucine patch superfamily enzyme
MLYGYKVPGGQYLPKTRISNMTSIGSRENLKIEDNVYINHFCFLDCSQGMSIGEGCQIGSYTSIITHSSHIAIRLYGEKYLETENKIAYDKGPVRIGKYTFIGPNSIVASGTTIGKGCLVAAYSYLQGDYPDFSIIAGNPAKVIGSTKNLDQRHLKANPDLQKLYDAWALDS